MSWSRAELAIPQGAHLAPQCLPGDADPKLLPQPLAKIDQTPAHDIVDGWDRTALNDRRQRPPMRVGQSRLRAGRLAIDQAIRPLRVEPQHPVPDDLLPDITDARCLAAAAAIVDHRQCQQPTCLLRILRSSCQPPQITASEVRAKRDRCCHGGHPYCPPS